MGQPKGGGAASDYPTAGFGRVLRSSRKSCSLPVRRVAPPLRTTKLLSRSSSGLVLRTLGRLVVPPDAGAAQGGSGRSDRAGGAGQRAPIRRPKLSPGTLSPPYGTSFCCASGSCRRSSCFSSFSRFLLAFSMVTRRSLIRFLISARSWEELTPRA